MVFTRVGIVFSILITVYNFIVLQAQQQCTNCETRDFSQNKLQACICSENQYCNVINKKCSKCDTCYDNWNNIINGDLAEIKNFLNVLIKKYEVNLDELRNLLKLLRENVKKTESELKKLKLGSDQNANQIIKVDKDLKKLKKDLQELEEKLKNIGELKSVPDVVNYLKNVINVMKNILTKLKIPNFVPDDIILAGVNKIRNIEDRLNNTNKNFPVIEKDPLNLALSLESDVDLLESIITGNSSSYTDGIEIIKNLKDYTKWIENDLLWLFFLLNNYGNIALDIEMLQKNASSVRTSAQKMKSKLEDLLQKHENFEKRFQDLKNETKFYKELQDLHDRLRALKVEIEEIQNLLKIWRKKKELYDHLVQFHKDRNALEEKEKKLRKYKDKLEKLYKEKRDLIERYEKNVKLIEDIRVEIQDMEKELNVINNNIVEHCRSPATNTIKTIKSS